MTEELWKSIIDTNNQYEISTFGRIRSLKYDKIRYMSIHKGSSGYLACVITVGGERRNIMPHRVLALAFIPNPNILSCVNHKDGNRSNNSISNLEWVSDRENVTHMYSTKNTTSKFPGVTFLPKRNVWISVLYITKKTRKHLGTFITELEAYEAYKKALIEYKIENKYVIDDSL